MGRKEKVYSGIADLPNGDAPKTVVPGCMVLEGGAFRGLYGEGVLDFLMQQGINLQCTIGVSAGAMNGFHYVSGQIGRSARVNLGLRHDPRYVGRAARKNNQGIIGFDYIYGEYEKTDPFNYERFESPERRFIAVATNVGNGQTVYFEKGVCKDIRQAIRASASMPYLSKPVPIEGIYCLDGGCSVKIPFRWALEQDFEKVVVIRTRQKEYRRKEKSMETRLANLVYRRYPDFVRQLKTGPARANADCDEIDRLEEEGRMFVISPSEPVTISRIEGDMEKLGALYYLGRRDAERLLPDLKKYLNIS